MQARRKSKGLITNIRSTISSRNTNLELDDGEQRANVECVLRIINNFIEKLQVALILPHVVAVSKDLLEEEFKVADLQFSTVRVEGKEECKATYLSDESVFKLLEFIEENFKRTEFWERWLIFLTTDNQALIEDFSLLYNIIKRKLSKSALSDLAKEKKLFKLQQNVASLDKNVADLTETLRKQRIFNNWQTAFRAALIHKYEEDLAFQKWDNNMRIKQEVVKSSKNIQDLEEKSNLKLEELEKEAQEKRKIYNKLLTENLLLEKEARTEKKKLLYQLQTYIRKYDQIIDVIKENLKLQEDYNARKRKFDEFMLEYREQEKEYLARVAQKEKEEQILFEQKLMVFMMGRAARAIQVRWRRFRRDQRKKSKKKGKGKKK